MTAAAVVRPPILLLLYLLARVAARVHFTATCLVIAKNQASGMDMPSLSSEPPSSEDACLQPPQI